MYQPKTFDYDLIVEEFKAEYKLDVKELKRIQADYIVNPSVYLRMQWNHLWPEYDSLYNCDIDQFDINMIPDRVLKPVYYLQSDKDEKTNPIQHYSLQEIMLSDLQNERNKNKRLMSAAFKKGDKDNGKRFNAMQLALKVNMNSTYGASNNAYFPHYDPDVAAAITWASRQCIGQLTEGLIEDIMYVDEEFIQDPRIKQWLKELEPLKIIQLVKLPEEAYDDIPRRRTLRRIFTDQYTVDHSKVIYKMIKTRCEVVYQDTDSNYFECDAVQHYYLGAALHSKNPALSDETKFRCSPELLYQMMNSMVSLDNLLCDLVVHIIDRQPIGLGFEGSFIVCRYLNCKKKYYGKKAADDDGNVFTYKLDDEAYDENGKLKPDFDQYWVGKGHCIPNSNGEYILVDDSVLLTEDVNYQDYTADYGVKTTGVDLTRRDKYKFIQHCHIQVVNKDLQICKFNKERQEWEPISLRRSIQDVVDDVIEDFKKCYNEFQDIANFQREDPPSIKYTLMDFRKNQRYSGKNNAVFHIIKRLNSEIEELDDMLKIITKIEKSEELNEEDKAFMSKTSSNATVKRIKSHPIEISDVSEYIRIINLDRNRIMSYIPYVGDRMWYIVVDNEKSIAQTAKGVKTMAKMMDTAIGYEEFIYNMHQQYPKEWFDSKIGNMKISYEDWFEAKCISSLYIKHYIRELASAMTLYTFADEFPDIAAAIDNNEYTDEEKRNIVKKCKDKIVDKTLDKYFPRTKFRKVNIEKIETKKLTKMEKLHYNEQIPLLISELYTTPYDPAKKRTWIKQVHNSLLKNRRMIQAWQDLQCRMTTNNFSRLVLPIGSDMEQCYKLHLKTGKPIEYYIEVCKKKIALLGKLEQMFELD